MEGRGSWSRGRGLGWGRGVKAALTAQHVIVGVICHRIYVGRGLRAALSLVSGYHGGCIDREPFVGVDGDTEEARVCLRRECIDRLLEAKFPSPGSSPRKTVTLAKSPKELLKVRCHTLCGRPSPALALTPAHSPVAPSQPHRPASVLLQLRPYTVVAKPPALPLAPPQPVAPPPQAHDITLPCL